MGPKACSPCEAMSRRPSARALALVLGILRDLGAEGGLVGELAGMAVEVGALPFGHRPADAPAGREIVAALACRQHGEGGVGNARGEEAVAAATKLDLGESGGRVVGHGGEGVRARSCGSPPLRNVGRDRIGRHLVENGIWIAVALQPGFGIGAAAGEIDQLGILAGPVEHADRAEPSGVRSQRT